MPVPKAPGVVPRPPKGLRLPRLPNLGPYALAFEVGFVVGMWVFGMPRRLPTTPGSGWVLEAQCRADPGDFYGRGSIYCGPIGSLDEPGYEGPGWQGNGYGLYEYSFTGTDYRFHRKWFYAWNSGSPPWPPPEYVYDWSWSYRSFPVYAPVAAPELPWWPTVYPEALPIGQPAGVPAPVPYPYIPSRPVPGYGGEPSRGNGAPAPAPRSEVTTVHGRPSGQTRHEQRPPRRGEKERKVRFARGVGWSAVRALLGAVTEGTDMLMCLHGALPGKLRAKPVWVPNEARPPGNPSQKPRKRAASRDGYAWRWRPEGWSWEKGYYRAPTVQESAMAVYRGINDLDIGDALICNLANQIEDEIIGRAGSALGKASRGSGRPLGYGSGPVL